MRVVLQRVNHASVSVGGETVGKISAGYVALIGFCTGDDDNKVLKLVDKIQKLRMFPDSDGKTNLSAADVNGEILVVSQFTLYADTRKGNRPSFTDSADPVLAESLYEHFIALARDRFAAVAHGVFGASMQVELTNDGPFTVILEA